MKTHGLAWDQGLESPWGKKTTVCIVQFRLKGDVKKAFKYVKECSKRGIKQTTPQDSGDKTENNELEMQAETAR